MLLVLLLIAGAASAQTSAEKRVTLCGRELARAHSLYCYGVEPFPDAVDLPGSFESMEENIIVIPKLPERFAYRARREVAAKQQQLGLSLMDACCMKPCHVGELLSHC